jgi:glutathione S-transferase
MNDKPYIFHGVEFSYFSAKVRPALRYKGVRYAEILADYQEIKKRTGMQYIPMLVTPQDEAWQDTSDILDSLEAAHPEPPLFPTTPRQRVISYLFELYSDEFMLLPAMHYRWNFEESEQKARGDFAAVQDDVERANRFADRMSGSLQALGVTDATIVPIETHFDELLAALNAHFDDHRFLLGDRPSLADCALMGPMYAHLYLDAVPGRIVREYHRVAQWVENTNHPIPNDTGDWLSDDAVADTMRALLKLIGKDAVPWVLDSLRAIEDWIDANPPEDGRMPRGIGQTESTLRGKTTTRGVQSYSLYMAQRAIDAYRSLSSADRVIVDDELIGTGCEDLFKYEPRHRLRKNDYELVLE